MKEIQLQENKLKQKDINIEDSKLLESTISQFY